MKKLTLFLSSLCFCLLTASAALAQVSSPPKVMLVEREIIKTGKYGDHLRESHDFARMLAHAKSANEPVYTRFGLTPVAGNPNEVLYLYSFESLAQWAQSQQDIDRWTTRPGPMKAFFDRANSARPDGEDLHVSQQSMVAVYQPALSLNPRGNLSKARYMSVTTIRVKPGQYGSFMKAVGMYTDALKRMKGDSHFAVYEAMGGAPEGTFLVLSSMASMAEMDAQVAASGEFPKAMGDKLDDFEGLVARSFESMATTIYAISPQMSNAPAEFHTTEAAFWSQGLPDAAPANGNAKMTAARKRR